MISFVAMSTFFFLLPANVGVLPSEAKRGTNSGALTLLIVEVVGVFGFILLI